MSEALQLVHEPIAGRTPDTIIVPETLDELRQVVRARDGLTLVPAGGRTRLDLGHPPGGPFALLDLSRCLAGPIEHQAADMTAVVPAAATIADINQALGEQDQFLPFDPPLPGRATLGGTLATGFGGPWQTRFGLPRDAVLGMTVLRPDGELVHAGGRVVKNVTGYDLMRLWCGSLGTLGVIVSAALRVQPRQPVTELESTIADAREGCAAVDRLLRDDVRPERAELFAERGRWRAVLRLPAAAAGAARQVFPLARETVTAAYERCRDLGAGDDAAFVLRIVALPAAAPHLATHLEALHPAAITVRPATGTLRAAWAAPDMPPLREFEPELAALRRAAAREAGFLLVERMPATWHGVIDPWGDPPPSFPIMRRTRDAYDPDRRINRGRYIGGL